MSATDLPAMELTRNTLDGTHGFICREHAVTRTGLAERHALNVEAKHVREHHADHATVEVNLSAAARLILDYGDNIPASSVWTALGLPLADLGRLARDHQDDVLAYVSPL